MPIAKVTGNIIGNNVRKARLAKNMDQVELAAKLEVDFDITFSQRTISDIEQGRRSVRDIELLAITRALNVTPNDLFGI